MIITIKKHKGNYIFYENETYAFWAASDTKYFRETKKLFYNDILISEINTKFKLPLSCSYVIRFQNTLTEAYLKFKLFHQFKPTCLFRNDVYEIIQHRGNKTSIFKNDIQIAYYEEGSLDYFNNHGIKLVANDDIDRELLFSFIVSLKCEFKNDDSDITYNLGNFSFTEKKKFDNDWKPI
jgi:hypothetical protein